MIPDVISGPDLNTIIRCTPSGQRGARHPFQTQSGTSWIKSHSLKKVLPPRDLFRSMGQKRYIEYGKRSDNVVLGVIDASFADDSVTRRSIEGYPFQLFGGCIDWRSTKQRTVTTPYGFWYIYNHWLRQEVQADRLKIEWVRTADMKAGGLTKPLPIQKHRKFIEDSGLFDIKDLLKLPGANTAV